MPNLKNSCLLGLIKQAPDGTFFDGSFGRIAEIRPSHPSFYIDLKQS